MTENVPALLENLPTVPWDRFHTVDTYWSRKLICHPQSAPELMPEADCHKIITEVESALVPADRKEAIDLGKFLLGCYPTSPRNDPEIYARVVVDAFQNAPPDIGKAAADHITRNLKFLPTRSEILEVLEELVYDREFPARMAREHLKYHKSRKELEDRKKCPDINRAWINSRRQQSWLEFKADWLAKNQQGECPDGAA